MPHITIQYSRNLEGRIDMPGLLRVLRDAAIETGVFPPAGIRARAFAADHVLIADGDPGHGFVDIAVRLRGGRGAADKMRATERLFDAAQGFCAADLAANSLMLSMEMRDIDPDLSPRISSIRRFLPEDMQS